MQIREYLKSRNNRLIISLIISFVLLLLISMFLFWQNHTPNSQTKVLQYEGLSPEPDTFIWRNGESKDSRFFTPADFDIEKIIADKSYESRTYFPKEQLQYKEVWQSARTFKYPLLSLKNKLVEAKRVLKMVFSNSKNNLIINEDEAGANRKFIFDNLTVLKNFHVFLDAGHGGSDPGALSPYDKSANNEFAEKNIAASITSFVKKSLAPYNITVHELRSEDEFVSIYSRSAKVSLKLLYELVDILQQEVDFRLARKEIDAATYFGEIKSILQTKTIPYYEPLLKDIIAVNKDNYGGILSGLGASYQAEFLYELQKLLPNSIFLSIHLNASLDPNDRGTKAYLLRNGFVYLGSQEPLTAKQEKAIVFKGKQEKQQIYPHFLDYSSSGRSFLALNLYRSVASDFPELITPPAKRLNELYFAVLRNTGLDSVLYETAFLTNQEDFNLISQTKNQQKMGESLAKGVLNYFLGEELSARIESK